MKERQQEGRNLERNFSIESERKGKMNNKGQKEERKHRGFGRGKGGGRSKKHRNRNVKGSRKEKKEE